MDGRRVPHSKTRPQWGNLHHGQTRTGTEQGRLLLAFAPSHRVHLFKSRIEHTINQKGSFKEEPDLTLTRLRDGAAPKIPSLLLLQMCSTQPPSNASMHHFSCQVALWICVQYILLTWTCVGQVGDKAELYIGIDVQDGNSPVKPNIQNLLELWIHYWRQIFCGWVRSEGWLPLTDIGVK